MNSNQNTQPRKDSPMNNTTDRAKIDRYIDSLIDMTDADLLAEYECCVRQNSYGSHDDQKALVRSVLLRRMRGAK